MVLRKAFGGAYIVMGSKAIGADLNFAWPSSQIAVLGAAGAVKLSPVQEVVGYLVFFGVILGLIVTSLQLIKIPVIGEDGTTTLMKLDTCVFPLIGALLMVAFGILKPKEAYVSIGMGGMVLTYVGVLALASGLTNTGTGALIGNAIASLFGQNANGYLIGLVFFLVPFVLTQFMMNWAVLNMFAPIAILTCTAIGANPSGRWSWSRPAR